MQYIFTFFEGIFAFISPCILPMLPIFLAYISADEAQSVKKRFVNTTFFVLGFSTVFVLMGATAFSFAAFLTAYKGFLTRLAGVGMVFFGFVYLDIIQLNLTGNKTAKKPNGLLGNFLFGVSYSFGWTPCLGAFLGSALMLAGAQQTALKGMLLLFSFSMGLGVPFILFSVLYEKLYTTTRFLKRHSQTIKLVGGIVLILTGVALVFDVFGYYLSLF
ncbi:MAG: cytochrome c biogenesis CcdA family protein [Oscillospiraceae bacterium]